MDSEYSRMALLFKKCCVEASKRRAFLFSFVLLYTMFEMDLEAFRTAVVDGHWTGVE